MPLVRYVLARPYTVVATLILVALLGVGEALRMPVDIFPRMDIPVVSVVWTYAGMSAEDMQNRILTLHERQLASLVDDIARIEATSYEGVGVEKIYLHEGADVTRAVAQLGSSALVVLKYMPPNVTPPLVIRYGATDVPIIQLSLASRSLPDTRLNDLGQNIIRPALAIVHGAEVPYPYGGKPRVIMADLDAAALQARALAPADVSDALQHQNVILPAGDVKIGTRDYLIAMNNSPDAIEAINAFPIRAVNGRTVFMRDVAHVHDGFQVQTNSVAVDGVPGALMSIRSTGGVSTLAVIAGIRAALPEIRHMLPAGVSIQALFDQSVFIKAALDSVLLGGLMAAGLTALMILMFLGNWRLTLIILASIPLSVITAVLLMGAAGQTLNTMTLGGFALAVGILVDNATVVIENIERHVGLGQPLETAIIGGAGEVGTPTFLVDAVHLHGVRAGVPASGHGQVPVLAPVGVGDRLAPGESRALLHAGAGAVPVPHARGRGPRRGSPLKTSDPNAFVRVHRAFERAFEHFREQYRERAVLGGGARAPDGDGVHRAHGVLAGTVPADRPGLLPAGRCRADAAARARPARHAPGDHPGGLRAGGGAPSAAWWGTQQIERRSSTTSACPTAASTSP